MKTRTRIILIIGLGLLGLALAVYLKIQGTKSSFTAQDDSEHLKNAMDDRNNKDRSEKAWTGPHKRIDIGVTYFIRQPVSREIVSRAAKLGIKIAPYYGSTKIAMIVMRSGESVPEFVRLLKESSASEAEITEERDKWWEENKERITKEQETMDNQPEVVAAKSQAEERWKEIEKMRGLTQQEYFQLQHEATQELNRIRQKYNGVTMLPKK